MAETEGAQEFLKQIRIIVSSTESFQLAVRPPPDASGGMAAVTLAREAMRWSYVLRNRERWRDNVDVIERHQHEATQTLHAFGLSDEHLRKIAAAGKVVVQMPYPSESASWAGRIFPWEYVLSRATLRYRSAYQRLIVMRHLEVVSALEPPPRNLLPKVLFVQSFPGALALAYDATKEADRMRGAFGLSAQHPHWRCLASPTLLELREVSTAFKPDIVHLAGCDNHQGLALLRSDAGGTLVAKGDKVARVDDWLRDEAVIDGFLMRLSDK